MFAPYCTCCTEQASRWSWRIEISFRKSRLFVTCNTPRSIGIRFSFYARNMWPQNTLNSTGSEANIWFMHISKIRSQLPTSFCLIKCQTERNGAQTFWKFVDWWNGRFNDITAETNSCTSASIAFKLGLYIVSHWRRRQEQAVCLCTISGKEPEKR